MNKVLLWDKRVVEQQRLLTHHTCVITRVLQDFADDLQHGSNATATSDHANALVHVWSVLEHLERSLHRQLVTKLQTANVPVMPVVVVVVVMGL